MSRDGFSVYGADFDLPPPPQTVFVKCLLTAIIKIACGVVKFQMAKL